MIVGRKIRISNNVCVEITDICNNHCLYCFAPDHGVSHAPVERILALFDILRRDTESNSLIISGGEPSTHPEICRILNHARELGFRRIIMLSNGRKSADPGFCHALFDAGLTDVQISVESLYPEVHDQMVGTPGAWQQTIAGLKNIQQEIARRGGQRSVNTNTTLTKLNIGHLSETIEFLAGLGVRQMNSNICLPSRRGTVKGDIRMVDHDCIAPFLKARERAQSLGVNVFLLNSFSLCQIPKHQLDGKMHYSCAVGHNLMEFNSQQQLLTCGFSHRVIGDPVAAGSMHALWFSDLMNSYRSRDQYPVQCHRCKDQAQCGGMCLVRNEADLPCECGTSDC